MSSRAWKTSAGMTVFFPALCTCSFALFEIQGVSVSHRVGRWGASRG